MILTHKYRKTKKDTHKLCFEDSNFKLLSNHCLHLIKCSLLQKLCFIICKVEKRMTEQKSITLRVRQTAENLQQKHFNQPVTRVLTISYFSPLVTLSAAENCNIWTRKEKKISVIRTCAFRLATIHTETRVSRQRFFCTAYILL